MTDSPATFRDRMHALITPPEVDDKSTWLRVWVHVWRTLVITSIVTLALGLGWLLMAGLFVAAPHAIVTGTIGGQCVSNAQLDCVRAIADARQAVLFTAGGAIAVVGLYFTYQRWKLDDENTRIAADEGRIVTDRHRREGEQLEIGRISDALSLLGSENEAKQTAAISLLTDYALHTPEERHVQVILDVMKAFIEQDHRDGWKVIDGERTDERLPISMEAAAALRGLLRASSQRRVVVELKNLIFHHLEAPGSDWRYVRMRSVNFSRSNLADARFGPGLGFLDQVKFETTYLTNADFTGVTIHHVSFHPKDLHTDAGSAALKGMKFTGALMQVVSFHGGQLWGANFDQAKLRSVDFVDGCTVPPWGFVGAHMVNVGFPTDRYDGRFVLVSDRGTFPMRGHISPGLVTGYEELSVGEDPASDQSARDSGTSPGDSRTNETPNTDESPT